MCPAPHPYHPPAQDTIRARRVEAENLRLEAGLLRTEADMFAMQVALTHAHAHFTIKSKSSFSCSFLYASLLAGDC